LERICAEHVKVNQADTSLVREEVYQGAE